ncbi:MAG TPA: glutamate formimidoyltransferase [Bacteroidales bacterium]|nr:glutamate formimidoyltransferase [Bacteroidales bacterium]HRT33438.1 glutamate formimidoyltransferase [Bacteroidales bacterium]
MIKKLIECVPNFSEGRNMSVIKQITDEIESVEGVKLLNVDPGAATNRTVVTFVGAPEAVVEAAFRAIKKASEVIDMSRHHGEHPRMGATDVCPLIPIAEVSMEECAILARNLAKRVGEELSIPVYCYENSAFKTERRNLANCRSGEYEGLAKKFEDPEWKPDFGPDKFEGNVVHSGATAIGARDFLIAVNFNLNTTSTRRANAIAYDVREKGRKLREGNSVSGKVVKDANGKDVWIPGTLKGCKAIGWYIEEYGIAQVSMNVTNITQTPLHVAFDEVVAKAAARGIRVTGSEIVGLIPKKVLIDAGKYYLEKQQRSLGVAEEEIIKIAIKSMGLDDLKPFNPKEKVIEYLIEDKNCKRLVDLTARGFTLETASESSAPGGGSVSAYMGALGAALGTMVANLSAHKPGWDERWKYFSDWAEKGQEIISELTFLVDEDTNAFNKIMNAFSMPKGNDSEKKMREDAIQSATQYATEIPLKTMKVAYSAFDLLEAMIKDGNPNSVSDAGVGALAVRSAVYGAYMNVLINSVDLEDKSVAERLTGEAREVLDLSLERERELVDYVIQVLKSRK